MGLDWISVGIYVCRSVVMVVLPWTDHNDYRR